MGRSIPDAKEEEYERELQVIATKGVIQLFNTVSEFQVGAQRARVT